MYLSRWFLAAAAFALTGSVAAVDGKTGSAGILSNRSGSVSVTALPGTVTPSGVAVCFSVDGIASMDGIDDPDNIVVDLNIGAANELSGIAWDTHIETVGASWLSEATILFSDSTGSADPNGITLAPSMTAGSGIEDQSSGGVVAFSSIPLSNIVAGPDGILRLQFFEGFDDIANSVDANWSDHAAPTVCPGVFLQCTNQAACDAALGAGPPPVIIPAAVIPTLGKFGLLAAILALLVGTVLVLRRQGN